MKKSGLITATFFSISLCFIGNLSSEETIANNLQIMQDKPLDFGVIYIDPNTTGDIILQTNGEISSENHLPSGSHSVGEFKIVGQANTPVSISLDNPEHKLVCNDVELPVSYNLETQSIILNAEGYGNVKIGGTLTILNNIVEGEYSGDFLLVASY